MARGWCPGVFTPMEAADGLLVRVKPRLGRLDAAVARRIAWAAAEFGNGRIELTSRANLQLRGLARHSVAPFARAMVACGAADADPATERRRNIVVSPLAGDDPTICGRPDVVAAALERALAQAADLTLPAKFGFAVDGGGTMPLGDISADVVIRTEAAGCLVWVAGAASALECREADAASVALALARGFVRLGGTRRMRDLVGGVGEDALYAAAALSPALSRRRERGRGRTAPTATPPLPPSGEGRGEGVAPPHPELTPQTLTAAADLACSRGDGTLRVTPWRTLLIGGPLARLAA